MNGKGDRDRVSDRKRFEKNYDKIDWGKKKEGADNKKPNKPAE